MIKRIFLIWGSPRQGKTTLSYALRDQHAYQLCTLDSEYVEFIRGNYPKLYFAQLSSYVAPHYEHIFTVSSFYPGTRTSYTDQIFGRDVRSHWHTHLLQVIRAAAAATGRVAVEGCLLKDCRDYLAHELRTQDQARVVQILVDDRRFYETEAGGQLGPFTTEQLIARIDS